MDVFLLGHSCELRYPLRMDRCPSHPDSLFLNGAGIMLSFPRVGNSGRGEGVGRFEANKQQGVKWQSGPFLPFVATFSHLKSQGKDTQNCRRLAGDAVFCFNARGGVNEAGLLRRPLLTAWRKLNPGHPLYGEESCFEFHFAFGAIEAEQRQPW